MKGILDFFEIVPSSGFDVPAQEAIDRFQAKGLKTSFHYADVMRDEHKAAFTVAKMMDMDMLADVKASLDDAIANGVVFRDWADNIIPMLQQKGWWGRQAVLDPLTGETIIGQLGSPGRLKTIFRTNMASAYAAGHWDQIEAQAEDAPYLMYDAIDDYRTRAAHKAWDGKVLPVTDTFWKFHTPPCGYNCRCTVIQLDDSDLEQLGVKPDKSPKTEYYEWKNPRTGKTIKVPQGVDPGFGHAAASRVDDLRKLAAEKAKALPTEPMVSAATKALAEMDKALAEKTPYLSTAIKSLKAKSPELGPVQMLAEAQAKAAKAKQSAWLSEYKSALVSGKKIPANAQAAFDALPQEAQLAMLKDIEQKSALLKATAEAQAKIDAFTSATPSSAQGKALVALQKAGELEGLSIIEQAAKLEAKVIEVKAQANTASMISGYKAKIVAGKIPTEAQVNAFKSLPEADQQKVLADIDKKKAKLAPQEPPAASPVAAQEAITPEPAPAPSSGDNFVQIGPQKGSNPGGLFQDPDTGEKWYVKWPSDFEQARNELLTAKLYELAGVDVPEYKFVTVNGKQGIASRYVDGLEKSKAKLVAGANGVADGFVSDAWLANWDVVGAEYDNMLLNGSKAFRVDTGGGLLYRAQGLPKGSAFGDSVTELDTLRDASKNAQASEVFKKLSTAQIEASAARVLAVKNADIERLVDAYGPTNAAKREKLKATLLARKNDIAKRFPHVGEAAEKAKQQAIEQTQFAAQDGLQEINGTILTAIKGISARASKGAALEAKDIERVVEARKVLDAWVKKHGTVLTSASLKNVRAYYDAWIADLDNAVAGGAGSPAKWGAGFFDGLKAPVEIDPSKVKIKFPPAGMSYTQEQAKQVITQALGSSAANINVPKGKGHEALADVPLEHQRAISAYTGSYYGQVNRSLRNSTASAEVQEYARLLSEALDLAPKYQGSVARGVGLSGSELERFIEDHRQAMLNGSTVTHKGFISTTKGNVPAFNHNVWLHIESKTGVWVNPISLNAGRENEVLLKHMTSFTVSKVEQKGDKWHIYMKEV